MHAEGTSIAVAALDLSRVLILSTAVALLLFGARLARAPLGQVVDWWVALAIVVGVSGAAWLVAPGVAGFVAAGAMALLVAVPLRLDRSAQRAARVGDDARAQWLARLATALHPFGGVRARGPALAVFAEIRAGHPLDDERLGRLGVATDPVLAESYRIVAMHAAGDSEGVRLALALPSRRARVLPMGLGAVWIRAVAAATASDPAPASARSRSDLVDAIHEAERLDVTLVDPERRALFALEVCAALGDVEGAREIGAHAARHAVRGTVERAIAAAQGASGDVDGARATIDAALARDVDPVDPGARRLLIALRASLLSQGTHSAPSGRRGANATDSSAALAARVRHEASAGAILSPLVDGGGTPARLTNALAAILVAVYAVVALTGEPDDPNHLASFGGLIAPMRGVEEGWRLFTAAFLHAGLLHLALNVYALLVFGRFVESFYGKTRFVAVYVTAVVTSGLGYVELADPSRNSVLVGASGAIFGLGGALVAAVLMRADLRRSRRGREELRTFAILLGVQIVFDRLVPSVSGAAHLFGLAGGVIAGALLAPRRGRPATSSP